MHIIIGQAADIEFTCLEDLNQIIPNGFDGKAINYGQGEGQIQIASSIWGIYVNGKEQYHLQFEEGMINWPDLILMAEAIMNRINDVFGGQFSYLVRGALMHCEPNELYLSE